MSIAIFAAAAVSQFFTALVITLFVLVGQALQGMTVFRGRRAIRDLLEFLPRTISVRRAGGASEDDADELASGDTVLVNPGGRIPVDGTVIAGRSFVDQSRITGESLPVEKSPGSSVFAGSISQSGALEVGHQRRHCEGLPGTSGPDRAETPGPLTLGQLRGFRRPSRGNAFVKTSWPVAGGNAGLALPHLKDQRTT